MTIPTFIQNSRINQVVYQIRDGHLFISARPLVGRFKEYRLDLRSLDPDYQPLITRNYALLIIPLITLLLCAAALWGLMHQTLLPGGALHGLYQWPLVGFVSSLVAAIRGSRRIEYFQFKTRWGTPALTIIREREQTEECAAFITTLVGHIEVAQSELSPEERRKLLRRLEEENPITPTIESGVALWKMSLAAGALAFALPWLPNQEYYFAGFIFPLVFILCVCGAACSVYSFLYKEPKRWWSAVGLVLSLIPVFLY